MIPRIDLTCYHAGLKRQYLIWKEDIFILFSKIFQIKCLAFFCNINVFSAEFIHFFLKYENLFIKKKNKNDIVLITEILSSCLFLDLILRLSWVS